MPVVVVVVVFNEVNFQSPLLTLNLPQSEQTLVRA